MTDKPHNQDTPPGEQSPRTDDEYDDAMAIQFQGQPDEKAAPSHPEEKPSAAEPSPVDRIAADGNAPISGFQIEGFDDDRAPSEGHLFAEAPPEPPRQPYEIVHEPQLSWPHRHEKHDAMPTAMLHSAQPPLWVRFLWGFMPLIVFVMGYGSVVLSQDSVGYAWDEAYYYEPALKAADWLTEALRGNKPFDAETIDHYWANDKTGPEAMGFGYTEHPSISKLASGVALRIFKDPQSHLFAMRLPIAIMFGMTLSLIYLLGRRAWGPVPGLVAVVIFATMPRVFGHAHFTSMETPLIFMMVLVVFCYLRGLDEAAHEKRPI